MSIDKTERFQRVNMILFSKASGVIPGLFLLFFSFTLQAEVHVAVLDTGFCPSEFKGRKVAPVIDFTSSVVMDCTKIDKENQRYHGHFVLKTFFDNLKKKDVRVTPLIVFDREGIQKEDYWIKALSWLKNNKVDIILIASGLITNNDIGDLPVLTFAASGQVSGKIRRHTKVWPQSFEDKNKMIMIGNLLSKSETDKNKAMLDPLVLHQEKINYTQLEESSSKAVARALGKALELCNPPNMKICLKEKARPLKDEMTGKTLFTY